MVDITDAVGGAVAALGIQSGAVLLHVPHTTAAVTVNEGYDPDVAADMLAHLAQLVPRSPAFAHAEGNSDSHIKAIMVGSSQPIAVEAGAPALGRWQRIFFCEFDGPRSREVWVTPLG
jgi:secondary thiamine-phosphate synthase enzyme